MIVVLIPNDELMKLYCNTLLHLNYSCFGCLFLALEAATSSILSEVLEYNELKVESDNFLLARLFGYVAARYIIKPAS